LLENKPSPNDSPSDSPRNEKIDGPVKSAVVGRRDSKAMNEWIDRIIWISDPKHRSASRGLTEEHE
jgi:hypothetical protein